MMEAAGIEPASAGSRDDSEEDSDLPRSSAAGNESEPSHEVAEEADSPRSLRGPSGEAESATPGGAGDEPAG
jgi:hypothetical protein